MKRTFLSCTALVLSIAPALAGGGGANGDVGRTLLTEITALVNKIISMF